MVSYLHVIVSLLLEGYARNELFAASLQRSWCFLMFQIHSSVADFCLTDFSSDEASRWYLLCDLHVCKLPFFVLM